MQEMTLQKPQLQTNIQTSNYRTRANKGRADYSNENFLEIAAANNQERLQFEKYFSGGGAYFLMLSNSFSYKSRGY